MLGTRYPRHQWTWNYKARLWLWQRRWHGDNLTAGGNGNNRNKKRKLPTTPR